MLGVLAAPADLGALRRVVEVGQRGVVELQVGAAESAQAGDLVGVGGGQVGPELLDVGVDRRVEHGGAAAVVHHVRRRDRLLGHGRGHLRLGEREVLAEDGAVQVDLAVDVQRGGRALDVARRVMELHFQVAGRLGHAAEGIDEVHVPGGAAELPVGGRLQAHLLLHPHRLGDLHVLDGPQVSRRDPAGGEVVAGLVQARRAQQAANVVGAERRAGSAGHGATSLSMSAQHLADQANPVWPSPRATGGRCGVQQRATVFFISTERAVVPPSGRVHRPRDGRAASPLAVR